MPNADLILHSTRSQKFSCIVPSKDCLSNSAAAADTNAEQRLRFYRRSASRKCKNVVFAGVLSPLSFAIERKGAVGDKKRENPSRAFN